MRGPTRGAVAARRGARAQRGLGIIEVLVALVVVSLGVLGIAGLQMTGMQHGTGSLNRAKALGFAEDVAERLRVNADDGLADAGYDGFDSTDAASAALCDAAPAPYCEAAGADCGTGALAAFDLASVACGAWVDGAAVGGAVTGALPAGTLVVDCDDSPCTPDSTWTVTVGWTEGGTASDADATRNVTMRLRP